MTKAEEFKKILNRFNEVNDATVGYNKYKLVDADKQLVYLGEDNDDVYELTVQDMVSECKSWLFWYYEEDHSLHELKEDYPADWKKQTTMLRGFIKKYSNYKYVEKEPRKIDKVLLAKLPKKYQPLFDELYYEYNPLMRKKHEYHFKLKPGYKLRYDFAFTNSLAGLVEMLRIDLLKEGEQATIPTVKGGKREGSGRKNRGYKMVSIRMTEEEKEAVKQFLADRRKQKTEGE